MIDTKQKTNELCQFIDIDGDGKREWIANQWNKEAPMMVWNQDDKGNFKGYMIGPHNGHGIGFGDLNNDGRSDIVIGTGWYERPEGNPYARPWKFHRQNWPKGLSCPVLIRDVNGDGKNDTYKKILKSLRKRDKSDKNRAKRKGKLIKILRLEHFLL